MKRISLKEFRVGSIFTEQVDINELIFTMETQFLLKLQKSKNDFCSL